MSQLDHIENRIRWRATKNALQTSNTGFWEEAPESLKDRAGAALEKPVFYSMADESTATIVGADGILLVDGGKTNMIPHIDLGGVYCQDVGIAAPDDKSSTLRIAVRNRGTVQARMEDGPASYCVWKVLRMLLDMREAWFRPEPVEEPPAAEDAGPGAEGATPEANDNAQAEAKSGTAGKEGESEPQSEAGILTVAESEGKAANAVEESEMETGPSAKVEEGKRAEETAATDAA